MFKVLSDVAVKVRLHSARLAPASTGPAVNECDSSHWLGNLAKAAYSKIGIPGKDTAGNIDPQDLVFFFFFFTTWKANVICLAHSSSVTSVL